MKTIIAKIVASVKRHRDRLWRGFVMIMVAWSGYNLGLIAARHGASPAQEAALFKPREAIVSQTPIPTGQGSPVSRTQHTDDPRVVVSKTSSSKKYHHPWCASASRIKEANRLWFPTAAAAQQAGYALAGNCTE